MMPSKRLKGVHSYVEPSVYQEMEEVRSGLRRISRSRFVEDAIVSHVKTLRESFPAPAQQAHGKRRTRRTG